MAAAARKLVIDFFGVKIYDDATVDRSQFNSMNGEAPADPHQPTRATLSRDVVIDNSTGVWVRIYIPERELLSASSNSHQGDKLPIILYFHGGGFVLGSAAHVPLHQYCCKMAAEVGAIVVSLEYRLAPEHRLPVAFEDAFFALQWLGSQTGKRQQPGFATEPWLSAYADFSSCFLMGHSAGGTIAHQTAIRAAESGYTGSDSPLRIRGLICVVPFFGGKDITPSEIEYDGEDSITLAGSNAMWALALPEGADRDHPFCKFDTAESQDVARKNGLPPSLVVLGGRDMLHDRDIQYAEFLKNEGVDLIVRDYMEYGHMVNYPEVSKEEDLEEAYSSMKHFMRKCMLIR